MKRIKLSRSKKGFTLIELLIVVAIIGIIAALLIPNFLDALNKARQKRTMADARNVGTAMFQWLTDQVGAAAAGQTIALADFSGLSDAGGVSGVLVSQYIQEVPINDGFKGPFTYRLNNVNPGANRVMLVASGGRDQSTGSSWSKGAFDPTDYDQDIVWADGDFIRWPQKIS